MIDKKHMWEFDDSFPQARTIKVESKDDEIELANKVAAVLERESEALEKEKQDNKTSRFFSTT